jgi:protein arginine kinase activator
MICQICQKRTANVHFTQVVNSRKIELYLCEQCAREKGQLSFGSPLGIADFFAGLMGFGEEGTLLEASQPAVCCQSCGMTYDDFQKTGKLGCSECYKLYGDRIKPVLKRLHGNTEHTGKVPAKMSGSISDSREVEHLKELLNKAVQAEQYEKAAEYRDRIRQIEGERQG